MTSANYDPRTTFRAAITYGSVVAMVLTLPSLSHAQSFTVVGDPVNAFDFGKEGSFLEEYYDQNGIAFNSHVISAANPSDGLNDDGFLGTNYLDVDANQLNLEPLEAAGYPTAISAGYDPLDDPWDVFFSVQRFSDGQVMSNVRERADKPDAGLGADVFYNHNTPSFLGRNHWHRWGPEMGLRDVGSAEITSMELYDSRLASEAPFKGFNGAAPAAPDTDYLYFTTSFNPSIQQLQLAVAELLRDVGIARLAGGSYGFVQFAAFSSDGVDRTALVIVGRLPRQETSLV